MHRIEGTVSLLVSDDGIGFVIDNPERNGDNGGFGLLGIRERVELLNGTMTITSNPGEGTITAAEFSLNGAPQ